MKREIEFRAWDIQLSRYNKSIEMDCFGNIQEYKYSGSAYYAIHDTDMGGNCLANDRFLIEQYTGLKDKNGVKIFEGDLLTIDSSKFVTQVVFVDGAFRTISPHNKRSIVLLSDLRLDRLHIMGNIHQNKHLLNKK